MRITKQYRTETGHRLMDYDGKCAHLHGHSYLWEVTVEALVLNKQGFVLDFSYLKQFMRQVIEPFDHAMLLRDDDPLAVYHRGREPSLLDTPDGELGRIVVLPFNPTAEYLAEYVGEQVQLRISYNYGDEVKVVRVRVWETVNSYAEWEN